MCTAFEITEDDIENVLRANSLKVANTNGKSFAAMASELYGELVDVDFGRIERAALASGVDLDAQTDGAYAAIRAILVERGVLDLRGRVGNLTRGAA